MPSRSLLLSLAALVVVVATGPTVAAAPAGTASDLVAEDALAPVEDAEAVGAEADAEAVGAVGTSDAGATPETQQLNSANVTTRVQLREDGDARWTVTMRFVLADDADHAAFERLAADFETNDASTPDLGLAAFRRAADRASEATGRSMSVESASRDTAMTDDSGRLVLEFTWTDFGRVDGDRLVVADAFRTPTGKWLRRLPANQTLVIAPPPGYNIVEAPRVEDRTARWDGPYDFSPTQPRVVFASDGVVTTSPPPTGPTPTPTPTPTVTPTTPGATDGGNGGFPLLFLAAAVVVLGGAAVLMAFSARRGEDGGLATLGSADGDDGDDGGAVTSASDAATDDAGDAAVDTTDGAAAAGAAAADEADDAVEKTIDEELLSDEERVERLLEQNGGRMKQASIVKETGWSNAKVSQLLSSMDEQDRIDKLRIGRENLISFPDEDVTEFDSDS